MPSPKSYIINLKSFIILLLSLILLTQPPTLQANTTIDQTPTRQQTILNHLNNISTNTERPWRSELHKHTAGILTNQNLSAANSWFNNDNNLIASEWEGLMLLRAYHALKNNSDFTAKNNIRNYITGPLLTQARQDENNGSGNLNLINPKGSENHAIVRLSIHLLAEELAGNTGSSRYQTIRQDIQAWSVEKATKGYTEYFSPHYSDRLTTPLMNIYDYSTDAETRQWARMALDQLLAEYAVVHINGYRGGAMRRALQTQVSGDNKEITDGRHYALHPLSYIFFDDLTDLLTIQYRPSDQQIGLMFYATTGYRLSPVHLNLADPQLRGNYAMKSARRWNHEGSGPNSPDAYIYTYATPHYVLSSIRIPEQWASGNDVVTNGIPYRINFRDPQAMLGTKVSPNNTYNLQPANSRALFQDTNVLLFQGQVDTYADVPPGIQSGLGIDHQETDQHLFFREAGDDDQTIYVGVKTANGVGVMEVRLASQHTSWTQFKTAFKNTNTSLSTSQINHTTLDGRIINYQSQTNVTINGQSIATTGWKLYDSSRLSGAWAGQSGSPGIITIGDNAIGTLKLQFTGTSAPLRTETLATASPTPTGEDEPSTYRTILASWLTPQSDQTADNLFNSLDWLSLLFN